MAGRTKIVDETEVRNWIEQGKTYKWMQEEYLRKYDLEVGFTMFSNFRRRRGLDRRTVRDDELIPWEVKPEHRYAWSVHMLRVEARRRAGKEVTPAELESLEGFKRTLERERKVVSYDPESGFSLVSARPGKDLDMIREPRRKTTVRPAG